MHAYLIIGNPDDVRNTAYKISKENGAKRVIDFEAKKVGDTRNIKKFTKLNQNEKIALFIESIDQSTTEAANALLKSLEEKDNYLFLLTAKNKKAVLPTIISRCQVVEANREKELKIGENAKKFVDSKIDQRAQLLNSIKGRPEALEFLDNILHLCSKKISEGNCAKYSDIAASALRAKKRLSANTNVYLQLLNFAIELDE